MTASAINPTADSKLLVSDEGQAITQTLSNRAASLARTDINDDAWRVARHCLLDWFGVAIAGATEPCANIIRDEAIEQAGKAQASLIAQRGARIPAAAAALVNGTASHAHDFDDVNYALHGHATVAVAPAVIALAEARGLNLEDALVAFVAGVEFACAAAVYVGGDHYLAGWHATSTIGALGAAAGCARLLSMNGEQTAHAVGLAATQSSGLKSMFGTMAKPFHAGRAARSGIESATWVERGFETRNDSLECSQGLAAAMHGKCHESVIEELLHDRNDGRLRIQDTLFKYHASCFETHATIEACLKLAATASVDANSVLARVEDIEINVRPANFAICNLLQPASGIEAKFSLTQTAAMALSQIDTGNTRSFNDSICTNPTTTALRERTRVLADDSLKYAQARVQITVHGEQNNTERLDHFYDASIPSADLDQQERRLIAKFNSITAPEETAAETVGVRDASALKSSLLDQHAQSIDVSSMMDNARILA